MLATTHPVSAFTPSIAKSSNRLAETPQTAARQAQLSSCMTHRPSMTVGQTEEPVCAVRGLVVQVGGSESRAVGGRSIRRARVHLRPPSRETFKLLEQLFSKASAVHDGVRVFRSHVPHETASV